MDEVCVAKKYFDIEIDENDDIKGDYKIRDGVSKKHLALKLLKKKGFDASIIADAEFLYEKLQQDLGNPARKSSFLEKQDLENPARKISRAKNDDKKDLEVKEEIKEEVKKEDKDEVKEEAKEEIKEEVILESRLPSSESRELEGLKPSSAEALVS